MRSPPASIACRSSLLHVTDSSAHLMGAWNGILGQGGLVGSPLARPYLHLVYNVIEVAPLVIAYDDQSRLIFDRTVARPPVKTAVSISGYQ